jgi:hypothetical protein
MNKAGIIPGQLRSRAKGVSRAVNALSFHSLRHSFDSVLANAGVPQELRMKLTGHSSADMNAIYGHHQHANGCHRGILENKIVHCSRRSVRQSIIYLGYRNQSKDNPENADSLSTLLRN